MIDPWNPDLAEAVYHFIMDDDERRYEYEVENMCMCEIVEEFYLDDFENWLKEKGIVA